MSALTAMHCMCMSVDTQMLITVHFWLQRDPAVPPTAAPAPQGRPCTATGAQQVCVNVCLYA